MALTRAQLRSAVSRGLGNRTDFADSDLNSYLDLSQRRIARDTDWEGIVQRSSVAVAYTAVAETDRLLDLPTLISTSNLRAVESITLRGSGLLREPPLERWTRRQMNRLAPRETSPQVGVPRAFTVYQIGQTILWPAPDQAYTAEVWWWPWPASLSSDASTSELDRKDDLIIHATLSFAFSLLPQRRDYYTLHEGHYKRLLEEARKENAREGVVHLKPNWALGGRSTNPVEDPTVISWNS